MLKRYKNKKVDADWLNTNFPCMMACPAHTNAGRYLALIAEGRFEEAYRFARDPNPLASICGRVCAHPCESACRRGEIDRPIAIRSLKRFLTERYGAESKRPVDVNSHRRANKVPYKVAVVGGGNSALTAARDLLRFASELHLIHRGEKLSADEDLVKEASTDKKLKLHLKTNVLAFLGEDKLTGVRINSDGKPEDLLVDGVFLEVGLIPNSAPLIGLVQLNERGEVPVAMDMSTSFPGFFAAGDVTDVKDKQISIAIGQGAQAALSAYEYLHSNGLTKEKRESREDWQ